MSTRARAEAQDSLAKWIDTYVLAELVMDALEEQGVEPTFEKGKEYWLRELEELGASPLCIEEA